MLSWRIISYFLVEKSALSGAQGYPDMVNIPKFRTPKFLIKWHMQTVQTLRRFWWVPTCFHGEIRKIFSEALLMSTHNMFLWRNKKNINTFGLKKAHQRGGWVRQRCCVFYVTGASNWYWLTGGQGLLSLLQVKVEGECFYFFCFFTFIHFLFSPVPLFHLLYYFFYLSSPFLWETT